MGLRKTIFGKQKIKPNTFIGGVAATLNTPALIASKLGISVSRIKGFSIVGNDIQFAITGGTYTMASLAFFTNTAVTYYYDTDYLITEIGTYAFFNATNLESISELRNCLTLGNAVFFNNEKITSIIAPKVQSIGEGCFKGMNKVKNFDFPELITLNSASVGGNTGTFENCTLLENINLPKLRTVTGYRLCSSCTSLKTFYAPLLTQLGISSQNNSNFSSIKNGATITVSIATQTIDSGAPDGDLVYASESRGATIIYI